MPELKDSNDAPPRINGDAVLVAQYFPPFNWIASQRALRMARALLARYDQVHVVTVPIGNLRPEAIDSELGRAELSDPRLNVIRTPPLFIGYGTAVKSRVMHRFFGALLTRLLCSQGGDWVRPVGRELRRIAASRPVKVVISTGGPFAPFFAVIRFARAHGIPCILDYRDLWTQNPRGQYPAAFRFIIGKTLERFVNKNATAITTVSNGCRESLRVSLPQSNVKVLLNTPDGSYVEWFRARTIAARSSFDSSKFNIVLTGTVYSECTCRLLISAILQLPAELRPQVKLHYYGPSGELVAGEFNAAKLSENCTNYGLVAKDDAVAAVVTADALLSLVFDSSRGELTSAVLGVMTTKVFDYFLSGKPIINVSPPEADVCQLARQIGYREFHSFGPSEESELARFITGALQDMHAFRRRMSTVQLPDFAGTFEKILADV